MTSKSLFFKAMREDLWHRLWMVALSVLANFLVHPVVWLMAAKSLRRHMEKLAAGGLPAAEQMRNVLSLCGRDALAFGGIVAIAGAMIVGMFGFRFLFHKNSVDLYHSLPVRRDTLYAVCYLNGFLIWFVPSFVGVLLAAVIWGNCLGMGISFKITAELLKVSGYVLLCSALVFFLVYHLVLLAVMLSGNILNTLVSMLTLGVGAIIMWSLGNGFFDTYMDTFSGRSWGMDTAIYASPLVSAPILLFSLCDRVGNEWMEPLSPWSVRMLFVNLEVTVLLGLCSWMLYRKRASEHAEQGIRNRTASMLMRVIAGLGAGMCGWIIFILLTGEYSLAWGCFGAVLAGGMAFGVMDIIFHMEFRAFFAHKLQMTVTLVLSLLICFAFRFDWFGYDTYLPAKEEIAEIAVYDYRFANRHFYSNNDSREYPLEHIGIQDMEIAYPYLEYAAGRKRDDNADNTRYQYISTKVTLKNGKSYYRDYTVSQGDREVLLPLLTSEAYLRYTYLVDEEALAEESRKITLVRGDRRFSVEKMDPETMLSIARAYNEDLLETPENVVIGRGRLLVRVMIDTWNDIVIDVYDSMERTVEALRQAGFGDWVSVAETGEIRDLELKLEYGQSIISSGRREELELAARLAYGVYGDRTAKELEVRLEELRTADQKQGSNGPVAEEYEDMFIGWEEDEEISGEVILSVTEREEIEELLELVSYETPDRGINLFQEDYVRITITFMSGKRQAGYLQRGKLPEKYIGRFGEL